MVTIMGEFLRDQLPDPAAYFAGEGLVLTGPRSAKWKTTRCDFHGGSDSMRVNTVTGGWVCMACNAKGGDVLAYHMAAHGQDFITAAKELDAWQEDDKPTKQQRPKPPPAREPDVRQHHGLNDWGKALWARTQELSGVAMDYLTTRHCCIPPRHGDLRWHPSLKQHRSGHVGPAMVALITDAETKEPLSLHRTWITPTGKAHLDTPRQPLWNHSTKNGVIRLWPDEEVNALLGIAEGIETALSLAWAPMPVWSVIDAGHMSKFPVLDGIRTLVIAQDQDPAGIAAAMTCAARWVTAGREVFATRQAANDLNDVVKEETEYA